MGVRLFPSASALDPSSWQMGRYYFVPNIPSTGASTLTTSTLRAVSFWVPKSVTLSRIGAEITIVGDAGSKLRLGIYNDDGNGRPTSLLLDAGTINGDSATVQEITINQALAGGQFYWASAVTQVVTTTLPTVRTFGSGAATTALGGTIQNQDAGSSIPSTNMLAMGFTNTGVTGALPPTFSIAAITATVPRIFVKVA